MRHPRTPWYAKALSCLTLLYALSPIDLIPDPIPVLGHLDDLILVPIGLWLAIRLVPAKVRAECEVEAKRMAGEAYSFLFPPRAFEFPATRVPYFMVFLRIPRDDRSPWIPACCRNCTCAFSWLPS